MTTVAPVLSPGRRSRASLAIGPIGIAPATGLVLAEAVDTLVAHQGLASTLRSGWAQLVAPAFVVLVLVALVCERIWPAERRPLLARGHLQDAGYFVLYILAIAPLMTLLSVGSAVVLGSHARWLEAPWTASWPRLAVVVTTLVAMDLGNWLAHVADHRIGAFWRVHALHHSQEEMSVLTSFRAHPLMHTSGFLLATVPVLALAGAHPLAPVLITVYVCLGTLPHTNVNWSYGPLGWVLVSPASHRVHHSAERQDVNFGVVLTVWDHLAGRAQRPRRDSAPCQTGLAGRPVPVEQAATSPGPVGLMARQLVAPFNAG